MMRRKYMLRWFLVLLLCMGVSNACAQSDPLGPDRELIVYGNRLTLHAVSDQISRIRVKQRGNARRYENKDWEAEQTAIVFPDDFSIIKVLFEESKAFSGTFDLYVDLVKEDQRSQKQVDYAIEFHPFSEAEEKLQLCFWREDQLIQNERLRNGDFFIPLADISHISLRDPEDDRPVYAPQMTLWIADIPVEPNAVGQYEIPPEVSSLREYDLRFKEKDDSNSPAVKPTPDPSMDTGKEAASEATGDSDEGTMSDLTEDTTKETASTPTAVPDETPAPTPTATPTGEPTPTPTVVPDETPASTPTATPTEKPTPAPTAVPTETPTPAPASVPAEELVSEGMESPAGETEASAIPAESSVSERSAETDGKPITPWLNQSESWKELAVVSLLLVLITAAAGWKLNSVNMVIRKLRKEAAAEKNEDTLPPQ